MQTHSKFVSALFSAVFLTLFMPYQETAAQEMRVATEMITMPTYTMGPDEKQPIFRGFSVPGMDVFRASRTTYPYPRADNFGHEREMN